MVETMLLWGKRAFWGVLAVLVLLALTMQVGIWLAGPPPAQAVAEPGQAQLRHTRVQALVNRLEAQLVAHVKSGMHDPGSFEIADETVTDRGSYVIVHIRFRGTNPMGATVLTSAVIAADLDGTVRALEVRN